MIIYSDLDGTFLDAGTYRYEASLPGLRTALQAGAAVVFCSSKTRAEIEELLSTLQLSQPFIVENGGAIFIPEGYFSFELPDVSCQGSMRLVQLGASYSELVRALAEVRDELGLQLAGFSEMSVAEVSKICGLSEEDAARAKLRQFDEPFVLNSDSKDQIGKMREAFAKRGFQITRGGRFFHLTGRTDKGTAVARLDALFKKEHGEIVTFAIGDSPNDLCMLLAADYAALVQKPDGSYDEAVLTFLPGVIRADGIGPLGWSRAIMNFIGNGLDRMEQ